MTVLSAEGLVVRRGGRPVLDQLSAALVSGMVTAVIGPNGAGKSTLLAALAGLLRPEAGDVRLDGVPLAAIGRRDLARRRAYLPQNPRAEWPIAVARVVALGLTPSLPLFGGLPAAMAARVEAALAEYDLTALAGRPATALSGGEFARMMLARATIGAPEVLIVDEPTAGLDPGYALDACRRLRAAATAGAAVVMAIHDVPLALRFADRVIALRDGRLIADVAVADVDAALLARLYDVSATLSGGHLRFD